MKSERLFCNSEYVSYFPFKELSNSERFMVVMKGDKKQSKACSTSFQKLFKDKSKKNMASDTVLYADYAKEIYKLPWTLRYF